jgi:pilus assembly protein Flp/PilA
MHSSLEYVVTWVRARFGLDDRGASLVEYAFLLAFIAIVCIAAVMFLGTQVDDKYSEMGSKLD